MASDQSRIVHICPPPPDLAGVFRFRDEPQITRIPVCALALMEESPGGLRYVDYVFESGDASPSIGIRAFEKGAFLKMTIGEELVNGADQHHSE